MISIPTHTCCGFPKTDRHGDGCLEERLKYVLRCAKEILDQHDRGYTPCHDMIVRLRDAVKACEENK